MVDLPPGILLPAAQVQDRGDRRAGRPRRDPRARYRHPHREERGGRGRVRGLGRRRARAHADRWRGVPQVPAQGASALVSRGDPQGLQPARPARQHLQGAHQDPGPGDRRRQVRGDGRRGVGEDQERPAAPAAGRDRAHPSLLRTAGLRGAGGHRSGVRDREAGEPRIRALGPHQPGEAQGAGLCHRQRLAEAGRRRAGRCLGRPDGSAGRPRRRILARTKCA